MALLVVASLIAVPTRIGWIVVGAVGLALGEISFSWRTLVRYAWVSAWCIAGIVIFGRVLVAVGAAARDRARQLPSRG